MTYHYIFENDGFELITEIEAESYGGDKTLVTVTRQTHDNHWVIECDSYYGSRGVCRLEITQPLLRALRTFGALLRADSEFEG